jgi:quinoprotein glucose dehydrogenase
LQYLPQRSRPGLWLGITAAIFLLLGLVTATAGGWLVALGGSPYYVVAGIALIANAVLLWRGSRFAYPLYALILLFTMLWAVWEAGIDFWRLVPRGDILVPLGVWLLLPWVVRAHRGGVRPLRWPLAGAIGIAAILLGVSLTRDETALEGLLPRPTNGTPMAAPMQASITRRSSRSTAATSAI